MSAEKFIDKMWPENKLALGVKEQWAELMEQYAKEANQSKGKQKQALIDMMKGDYDYIYSEEELGLYKKPQQQSEVEELAKALDIYVKQKHTQEECIGFIDGFKANTLNQDKDWKRVGELANEITKIVRNETIPSKTLG